jgi:hypothetical protein
MCVITVNTYQFAESAYLHEAGLNPFLTLEMQMHLTCYYYVTEQIGSSGNASHLYRELSVSNTIQVTDYTERLSCDIAQSLQ